MADSPFPDDDSEPGTVEIAEAMVSTMAIERGGLMRIDHDRVSTAAKIAAKRYPNGIHAHFTADDRALQVELVDRTKCTMRSETRTGVATYEVSPQDGRLVLKGPEEMDRSDLESINHAQHVLIMAALHRLGEVAIEVTQDEFEDMVKGRGMAVPALQITKKGGTVYASLLSDIGVGRA